MADDDKELFAGAMTDEPEAPQVEGQEPEQPQDQPRDEHGRFAPKANKPEEQPQVQEQPQEPVTEQPKVEPKSEGIPSWRLKEEAEARRAAEERARQYERDMADLRRQLAQQQPKQEQPVPDIFENPNAFVDHNVRTAVDPVRSAIDEMRVFYSRRDAEREFGPDKVKEAIEAFGASVRGGDNEAVAMMQQADKSMHPVGDIVSWHQRRVVFSQIGSDPNAWFEKQLEERLKDPTHQSKLMERIRGNVQPQQRPITQLPPSLNKATSSASQEEDGDDNSEAGLLKSALRR